MARTSGKLVVFGILLGVLVVSALMAYLGYQALQK